jgi:hypothetical protein
MIYKVRCIEMAGTPKTFKSDFPIFLPSLRTFHRTTVVWLILLATVPAFAKHSSASYHLWNDPATKSYSHDGLPCSTAPVATSSTSKSAGSLRQLDQIEHARFTTVGNASRSRNAGGGSPVYRPALIHGGERKPTINFVYHAPVSSGSRTRGR